MAASAKMKHLAAITQLSAIMSGIPKASSPVNAPLRVGTAAPPRVAVAASPRVVTTSKTITASSTVCCFSIIHQRVTCNNNPLQILANTDDNNDDDDTVVHSNCSPRAPLPDLLEPLLPTAIPTPMPPLPIQRPRRSRCSATPSRQSNMSRPKKALAGETSLGQVDNADKAGDGHSNG